MADALNLAQALYVERLDTVTRNAALIGLAGGGDSELNPDSLAEFEDATTPAVSRQDPEERMRLIAAYAAG